MILPSIKKYDSCSEYIEALYFKNKTINNDFSYGHISNELSWPPSLIADLIKGRKKLSLQRALELGKWLKLKHRELDYLILLSLKEINNTELMQQYFNSKKDQT